MIIMFGVCNQLVFILAKKLQWTCPEYAAGKGIEKSGYLTWKSDATEKVKFDFSYVGSLAFNSLSEKQLMCIFCQKKGF